MDPTSKTPPAHGTHDERNVMASEVDEVAWQRLVQAVEAELAATPLPGAVLGIDGPAGRLVQPVGHGLGADTLLRLSSLTKPVLAAATLCGVEDGLLAVDDPIDRWLPEFAAPRVLRTAGSELADTVAAQHRLTVEDLLTMRLGTGFDYERPDSPVAGAAAQAQLGWGPACPHGSAPHAGRVGRGTCRPAAHRAAWALLALRRRVLPARRAACPRCTTAPS
jgi:CubicO group peptidase (beta-lactamase class C family)